MDKATDSGNAGSFGPDPYQSFALADTRIRRCFSLSVANNILQSIDVCCIVFPFSLCVSVCLHSFGLDDWAYSDIFAGRSKIDHLGSKRLKAFSYISKPTCAFSNGTILDTQIVRRSFWMWRAIESAPQKKMFTTRLFTYSLVLSSIMLRSICACNNNNHICGN